MIRDTVDYAVPLGPLGRLAHATSGETRSGACSTINFVASRTIRLGSMCSPLKTSSRRLRVTSLASTYFIGMLLSVTWIERRQASSP